MRRTRKVEIYLTAERKMVEEIRFGQSIVDKTVWNGSRLALAKKSRKGTGPSARPIVAIEPSATVFMSDVLRP